MNQMYLLLIGVLGIAAVGSLLSSDDDEEFDQGEEIPDLPFVNGTDDSETVDGTGGAEIVRALGGNDTVDAGAGDDWTYAGTGDDTVIADAGEDRVFLGQGDDVYGGLDSAAADGNDTIEGGSGDDTVYAGAGDDLILPGDEDDGDDVMDGGIGADTIDGGDGDDTLTGGADEDADSLLGGDGDDEITLLDGDFAEGGDGDDDYLLTAGAGAATIAYSPEDRLVVSYTGAEPEISVVQAGDNAQLFVDGRLLATLQNTAAGDVRVDTSEVQRTGGGYVVPVTDPEPVVIST